MSHIKLTMRVDSMDGTQPLYMPDSWSFSGIPDGFGSYVSPSSEAEDFLEVEETPAEIAALIESARREERIRDLAERLWIRCNDGTGVEIMTPDYFAVEAENFIDGVDDYLAANADTAERARKEGEKI